jgi:hypothetical protein
MRGNDTPTPTRASCIATICDASLDALRLEITKLDAP